MCIEKRNVVSDIQRGYNSLSNTKIKKKANLLFAVPREHVIRRVTMEISSRNKSFKRVEFLIDELGLWIVAEHSWVAPTYFCQWLTAEFSLLAQP